MSLRPTPRKEANVSLTVRGDDVGALPLLLKFSPSSLAQAIIARELVLHLVEMSFPPTTMHRPGLSHVVADKPARIHALGNDGIVSSALHSALFGAVRTPVPVRGRSWCSVAVPAPP